MPDKDEAVDAGQDCNLCSVCGEELVCTECGQVNGYWCGTCQQIGTKYCLKCDGELKKFRHAEVSDDFNKPLFVCLSIGVLAVLIFLIIILVVAIKTEFGYG